MVSVKTFLIILLIWNIYVFLTMGRDKRKAKMHSWRISEATLLWMGAAFGGVGLYSGMKYYHHKTAHPKFIVGAPLLIILNALFLCTLVYKHVIV
jgi:uncharacterized membrane protein YsdA (DUF1294 family)